MAGASFSLLYLALVLAFCCVFGQDKREPVCSRFHYEEMLLEKMIRLEHNTDLMMKEFRNIEEKVTVDLERLRKETDNMKQGVENVTEQMKKLIRGEIEDMKKVIEGEIQDMDTATNQMTEAIKGEIEDMDNATEQMKKAIEGEIQTSKDVIRSISASIQKSSYAFSAYWLTDTSLSFGQDVVFSKTILNERQMYDVNSGKYRVPVTGVYYFTSTLCVGSQDYGAVNFVADGERIGAFDTGDNNYYTCSSGSAIAKLQKGASVWLKVTNDMTCKNSDAYGGFNYFAGFLVNEE